MENLVAIADLRQASASRTQLLHQVITPCYALTPTGNVAWITGERKWVLFPGSFWHEYPGPFSKRSAFFWQKNQDLFLIVPAIFWQEIQDLFADSGASFWQMGLFRPALTPRENCMPLRITVLF
jgi:hypothetical protein